MEFDFLVLSGDSRPLLTFALKNQTFAIHGSQPEERLHKFSHCACHTAVMPCHRGLQGTFHARADLPQPSEFQGMFAMETWFLAATKAKKSLPRQNEICFIVKFS